MSQPSLKEILGDIPSEELDRPCQDEHLCQIALEIVDWKGLAPFLQISSNEENDIETRYPKSTERQKIELLREWYRKHRRKRRGKRLGKHRNTYRKLCRAFVKAKKTTLAETVCDVLCNEDSSPETSSDEDDDVSTNVVENTSPSSDELVDAANHLPLPMVGSLDLQELVAALRVSTLTPHQQLQVFNKLLEEPSFEVVFSFCAAVTKLEVNNIVTRVLRSPDKTLLLNLIHCVCRYEARDVPISHVVSSQLNGTLNLSNSSVSPLDILSVGYFVSCVNCRHQGCSNTPPYLTKLILSNCELKPDSIGSLPLHNLDRITQLDLSNNAIDDTGLRHIANGLMFNNVLLRLILYGCSLTVTDGNGPLLVEMLHRNTALKEVDLTANPIGAGLKFIFEGLRHNSGIVKLLLCGVSHQVGIEANNMLVLQKMLLENNTLQELDLSENLISSTGLVYLAIGMTRNSAIRKLSLRCCSMAITEDNGPFLERMLRENRALKELNLETNSIGACGLRYMAAGLRCNTVLEKVSLRNCGLEDKEYNRQLLLEMFQQNTTVEQLDLSDNLLTDEGIVAIGVGLKSNVRLKVLNLQKSYVASDKAWRQFLLCLRENKHLTQLNMWYSICQEAEELNEARRQQKLPLLEINGHIYL